MNLSSIFIGAIICFIVITNSANAEYYKYIDNNGAIAFTDDLSKIPESRRNQAIKYHDRQLNNNKLAENGSTHNINSPSSFHEQSNAKQGLSQKELESLKAKEDFVNNNRKKHKNMVMPQDTSLLTKQEISELDKHLKSIFWEMIDALKNNNIDLALSYFADRSKNKHRMMFEALSPEAIRESVRNTEEISFESILGYSVKYEITTTQEGKKYSFPLIFTQDLDGKWKILEY